MKWNNLQLAILKKRKKFRDSFVEIKSNSPGESGKVGGADLVIIELHSMNFLWNYICIIKCLVKL